MRLELHEKFIVGGSYHVLLLSGTVSPNFQHDHPVQSHCVSVILKTLCDKFLENNVTTIIYMTNRLEIDDGDGNYYGNQWLEMEDNGGK